MNSLAELLFRAIGRRKPFCSAAAANAELSDGRRALHDN